MFTIPSNVDEVELTRLKENVIFRNLYDSGDEKKSNFIARLEDIPIHILKYQMSTPWNVDGVQVVCLIWQKTSLFDPHMTPGGKMKIPNPYCTSARHAYSYPRVPIVYSWKCRCIRSSNDKLCQKIEMSFFDHNLTPGDKM